MGGDVATVMPEPTGRPASGRDWLKVVLVQLAALLVLAFVWLLWQLVMPISVTVVLFLLGAAFAFVLAEPSHALARRLGGRRALGIVAAYLITFAIVTAIMLVLAVPLLAQASEFVANMPTYEANVQAQAHALQATLTAQGIQLDVESIAAQAFNAVATSLETLLHGLLGAAATLGGVVMNAVLVLVISVYFLSDCARECSAMCGTRCPRATAASTSSFVRAPRASWAVICAGN